MSREHLAAPTAQWLALVDPYRRLMDAPLASLLRDGGVRVDPRASLKDTALAMRAAGSDLALLVEQDQLFGVVSDSDLRNRALAEGLSPETAVSDIATLAPWHLDAEATGFDALMLLARHRFRHLPVTRDGRVIGLVRAEDLQESGTLSVMHLSAEILRQDGLAGLVALSRQVPQLHRQLAAAQTSAYSAGYLVSAITDAIGIRLLQLAERELGPAPVDYAWVVAGSQARSEQTSKTDQDSCLLLADAYRPAEHGGYFRALADYVCDGLHACGYVYCPGEVMARTEEWRQPFHVWSERFRRWIEEPEAKALMLTSVFFDVRCLHGDAGLLDRLRAEVLARTRNHGIFLAHLVGNALANQPPLGLFGQLAPPRLGEHRGSVDIKHHGLVPVVDLARVYALAGGHAEVNTQQRLLRAPEGGAISAESARDLGETYEFLGRLRLQHQARQLEAGLPTDNHIPLDTLSSFEREQLKDAFAVIARLQKVLQQRYRAGWF